MLDRSRMAAEQTELLQALLCGKPAPAGFDTERIDQAAQALLRKRVRCMARADARIEALLDCAELNAYVTANPSVHADGPYADAQAFLAQHHRSQFKNWLASIVATRKWSRGIICAFLFAG